MERTIRAGLVDRKNGNALARLDLATGVILPSAGPFDIVIVEQPRMGDRNDPDFIDMKARLKPDGVIVLKRGRFISRWVGRLLLRRRDDRQGVVFGAGRDRREAALRRASLYLREVAATTARGRETWLVASTSPVKDERFRDQIGRVATDYLRTVPPITIAVGSQVPIL